MIWYDHNQLTMFVIIMVMVVCLLRRYLHLTLNATGKFQEYSWMWRGRYCRPIFSDDATDWSRLARAGRIGEHKEKSERCCWCCWLRQYSTSW